MKCADCILYQTGACADYSALDNDKPCKYFLSAERYEEMEQKET